MNKESEANKPDKHQKQDKNDDGVDQVKVEEIHIEEETADKEDAFQAPPKGRQFQVQTTGCIGALVSLAVVAVLFVVFLPIGILALFVFGAYLSWKMWQMKR